MMIRMRHFALNWGYDIQTDCPFSLTIALGHSRLVWKHAYPRYRLIVSFAFDWPKVEWRDTEWAVNEPGYLQGMPVQRQGIAASAWTGRRMTVRRVTWFRKFWWWAVSR